MRRPITIGALAKELGLSQSAVSKALNDYPDISPETKKLVRSKADELGYSPNILARNLAKKRSNFVGIVIRDVSSIYGEMFKSLNTAARRYGIHLILYDTNNDCSVEQECIKNLIDTMAMGIVVVPVSENVAQIRRMTRNRVPVVFLGGKVREDDVNYVCCDSTAGADIAMRHLIGRGHRKIVMLCDHKISNSRSRKKEIYETMMHSIRAEEHILYSDEAEDDLAQAGYRLGKRLLAEGTDFTALFAVKDSLAIGAAGALKEACIRVPEDVSIVGYDGTDASALPMIGLTTVAQPRGDMADRIIDIICRHAEEPTAAPEHYLARPELIIRTSTAVL